MQEQISFLSWIHVGWQGEERGVMSMPSMSANLVDEERFALVSARVDELSHNT